MKQTRRIQKFNAEGVLQNQKFFSFYVDLILRDIPHQLRIGYDLKEI
jgi:hypothetical protein